MENRTSISKRIENYILVKIFEVSPCDARLHLNGRLGKPIGSIHMFFLAITPFDIYS